MTSVFCLQDCKILKFGFSLQLELSWYTNLQMELSWYEQPKFTRQQLFLGLVEYQVGLVSWHYISEFSYPVARGPPLI